MEYAKSGVLNEEVRRKSQDISSHSQIFYIQKIEGDIRLETRVIEVKAEANQNSRI